VTAAGPAERNEPTRRKDGLHVTAGLKEKRGWIGIERKRDRERTVKRRREIVRD
jgi:hypothetical protein